jgi:hypothetical protein
VEKETIYLRLLKQHYILQTVFFFSKRYLVDTGTLVKCRGFLSMMELPGNAAFLFSETLF